MVAKYYGREDDGNWSGASSPRPNRKPILKNRGQVVGLRYLGLGLSESPKQHIPGEEDHVRSVGPGGDGET